MSSNFFQYCFPWQDHYNFHAAVWSIIFVRRLSLKSDNRYCSLRSQQLGCKECLSMRKTGLTKQHNRKDKDGKVQNSSLHGFVSTVVVIESLTFISTALLVTLLTRWPTITSSQEIPIRLTVIPADGVAFTPETTPAIPVGNESSV